MIVPSIYVPMGIPATRDQSGRRPAFVPEASAKTLSAGPEARSREERDSSEDVNDSGNRSLPEAAVAGTEEGGAADEAVRWPDEISEAAFLAEQPTQASANNGGNSQKATQESPRPPLPALQDLVDRIPLETRETLEDLFRARFVNVRYAEIQNTDAAARYADAKLEGRS